MSVPTSVARAVPGHRPRGMRTATLLLVLAAGTMGLAVGSLAVGSVPIPLGEVASILTGGEASRPGWELIVRELRLPRVLTALLAGAALAVGGLLLQTLFRNPLAGPWALGLTAGAQLGVALVTVVTAVVAVPVLARLAFLGNLSLAAGAMAGAVGVTVLVTVLARRVGAVTLLVAGLMFGFLAQGIVGVLLHFTTEAQVKVYTAWSDGSFGAVTGEKLLVLGPAVLLGLLLATFLVKDLNALLLGDAYAGSLGVEVKRRRLAGLAATVILAGSVTAYCGPVLFLDLAVPHLARGLFRTADHRLLVPATALLGALVALAADLVVHLPWRHHFLHLNSVTALIGAPVVLWVLLARRRAAGWELS